LFMFELPKVKRFRKWETLFIIHPDFVEQRQDIINRVKDIVESKEGGILKVDEWGLRKLAYPIEKKTHGYYVLIEFFGLAELPKELENFFRIDERVIRFIIVKLEDRVNPEELRGSQEENTEEVANG
jgi:small subunit ribosomal protein S6